ncbi:hypothetical protein BGZ95_004428 [Linnemannia exigua]|uniref:Uncharacterized protein n=1 Tax=Linnemannia exigua TaxID=604196 RepID=A0AAD4DHQ9_9FUNG|nr:hypothetical protein BGZ95_004428 [Linnemannia exigua]
MDSATSRLLDLPEITRLIAAHLNKRDLLSFMTPSYLLHAILEPCFYRDLVTSLTVATAKTVGSTGENERKLMLWDSRQGQEDWVRQILFDVDDSTTIVLRVCRVLSDLVQLRDLDLNVLSIKTRLAMRMIGMALGKMYSLMDVRVSFRCRDICAAAWMLMLACPTSVEKFQLEEYNFT